jgi:Domain of unknown function (DUF4326)
MPKLYNIRDPNCPPTARYIGRGTIAGNPFIIGRNTREEVVDMFERYVESSPTLKAQIIEYCRGFDLVCHCTPLLCHGRYCIRISNQ